MFAALFVGGGLGVSALGGAGPGSGPPQSQHASFASRQQLPGLRDTGGSS